MEIQSWKSCDLCIGKGLPHTLHPDCLAALHLSHVSVLDNSTRGGEQFQYAVSKTTSDKILHIFVMQCVNIRVRVRSLRPQLQLKCRRGAVIRTRLLHAVHQNAPVPDLRLCFRQCRRVVAGWGGPRQPGAVGTIRGSVEDVLKHPGV